mmetsp:Transcript_5988/g.15244  ORF Transcript_5988/g.15244 Transcript_5988/m.15244 type:complete len:95 (+) Transcript_5988:58-342(+)
MARGASAGGASQNVGRGNTPSRPGTGASQRPTGASPGNPRRRQAGAGKSGASSGLRFYGEEASGFQISPLVVLAMSLCFIGFVTLLHIIGKVTG